MHRPSRGLGFGRSRHRILRSTHRGDARILLGPGAALWVVLGLPRVVEQLATKRGLVEQREGGVGPLGNWFCIQIPEQRRPRPATRLVAT